MQGYVIRVFQLIQLTKNKNQTFIGYFSSMLPGTEQGTDFFGFGYFGFGSGYFLAWELTNIDEKLDLCNS